MKPGPKKTPTADLTSWRANMAERKNEAKVEPLREAPEAPVWLDAGAMIFWNEIAPVIFRECIVTALDVPAIGMLCKRFAEAAKYERLYKDRELIPTADSEKANPLIKARNDALTEARRYMVELGMTPSARIGLPSADKKAGKVIDAGGDFAKG